MPMLLIIGGCIRYNSIVLLSVFIVLLLIKSVSIQYPDKAVKTKKFDCKLNIQPLRQIYFPYSTVVVALFLSDCNPNTFSQQKKCFTISELHPKSTVTALHELYASHHTIYDQFTW